MKKFLIAALVCLPTIVFAQVTLDHYQPGPRLIDGNQLNKMVDRVNGLTNAAAMPVNTAITTAGAGTLTAAGLIGGVITRTGPSAAFTDTTATGTQLDTALPLAITSWLVEVKNNTAFAETVAAGSGVTVSGRSLVPANSVGTFLITKTTTATYTMVGVGVAEQQFINTFALVGTADNGTTQTLTAAMISGGKFTSHVSTGGTTPSITLPLGSAMDTALSAMATGQSYILRIINDNSGIATVVTNTGWTLTGTLTLAASTTRDFLITKTGTATYTGVSVGTGTNS